MDGGDATVSASRAALERSGATGLAVRFGRVWRHRVYGPLLKAAVGYLVLVEGVIQLVFGKIDVPVVTVAWLEVGAGSAPIPRGVFLIGAVIGGLYALVGMGLILVYRANRIINFAQAQLGSVFAVLALLLVARKGMPYVFAIPIVLLGGAALGAGVEVGIVRRFKRSSRLILTAATIGIGFLLLVAEFIIKNIIVTGNLINAFADFPTPFKAFQFRLGPTTFFGDHLITLAVAVAIIVGLGAFFRYTDIGVAVRAAAENRSRAALLGIPVDRVSTIVWALAGVLSAIAVFLRAPLIGLPLSGFVGPIFLLYGLTTAVVAKMEHLPHALLAGLFIGVVDTSAVFATGTSSLATATMLVVILIALLVQREGLPQGAEIAGSAWEQVREVRRIPSQLRDLPVVRRARYGGFGLLLALAVAAPWILGSARINFATLAVIYAMVGVSLVILTGWAGQISLGQFAIAGIGAAVAGGLAANHGLDFFLTLTIAAAAGAGVAILIGIPALRIQGLFLAVTTLAFAFFVPSFVLREEYFGWLLPGQAQFIRRPVLYGRLDMTTASEVAGATVSADAKWYLLCLVFLLGVLAAARSLRRYRSGRVLIGLRDNPRLMQAYGVSPAGSRLAAFAISGAIAAIAGALLAYDQGSVDALTYSPEASIELFVMTVLGGIGSLSGAVLGAVFLQGLPILGLTELPRIGEVVDILTTGAGVLLVLYFLPGGLAEGLRRLRDRWLRRVADANGIVVPSLVSDMGADTATGQGLDGTEPTGGEPDRHDEGLLVTASARVGDRAGRDGGGHADEIGTSGGSGGGS